MQLAPLLLTDAAVPKLNPSELKAVTTEEEETSASKSLVVKKTEAPLTLSCKIQEFSSALLYS